MLVVASEVSAKNDIACEILLLGKSFAVSKEFSVMIAEHLALRIVNNYRDMLGVARVEIYGISIARLTEDVA